MAQLTVKELEALTLSDDGQRLPDGKSMFGRVRANRDAQTPVSVNFEWRYKYEGKGYSSSSLDISPSEQIARSTAFDALLQSKLAACAVANASQHAATTNFPRTFIFFILVVR